MTLAPLPGAGVGGSRRGPELVERVSGGGGSGSSSGLVERWRQWQRQRRRTAAAPAAIKAPDQTLPRGALVLARAAVVDPPPSARLPAAVLYGGARLTAAIKATAHAGALLELVRQADPEAAAEAAAAAAAGGDSSDESRGSSSDGRRRASSSTLNALHAAAALTHCAQLAAKADAEAAPGMWRARRAAAAASGGDGAASAAAASASSAASASASGAAAPLLLAHAEAHAPRFSPRQCANAMWAIAKLGWLEDDDEGEDQAPDGSSSSSSSGSGSGSGSGSRAAAARRLLSALAARLDGGSSSVDGRRPPAPAWSLLQPQELVMVLEAAAAVAAAAAAAAAASATPAPRLGSDRQGGLGWVRGLLSALRRAAPSLGAREHCSVASALARLLLLSPSSDCAMWAARAFPSLVLDPALRGAWMYGPRDVASLLQALSLAATATATATATAAGGAAAAATAGRPSFHPGAPWLMAFLRATTDSADAWRAAGAAAGEAEAAEEEPSFSSFPGGPLFPAPPPPPPPTVSDPQRPTTPSASTPTDDPPGSGPIATPSATTTTTPTLTLTDFDDDVDRDRDGFWRETKEDEAAAEENDARAAAAALLALSRLRFLPPRAWLAPRLRALGSAASLRSLGTGGLALLGYAVARTGARPPAAWTRAWLWATLAAWAGGAAAAAAAAAASAAAVAVADGNNATTARPPTVKEAAMTAWALAKLRARPPAAWMAELAAAAGRATDGRAADAAADAKTDADADANTDAAVASSTVLWAFSRMGYRPAAAVERALLRALVNTPVATGGGATPPTARSLAVGLAAAARLRRPLAPPSRLAALPPGAMTRWLRAAASSGMCDADADPEARRARAVGAWALASLAAPVPPAWRRPFFAAAAAGLLSDGSGGGGSHGWHEDEAKAASRLREAATLAWAAARSTGRRGRGGDVGAATAVALAALRAARLELAREAAAAAADGADLWGDQAATPAFVRRRRDADRASAVVLCVWSGAKLAHEQAARAAAARAAAAAAAAGEEREEDEAAACAARALALRRATVRTMRALATSSSSFSDDEAAATAGGGGSCARALAARPGAAPPGAARDLAVAARATSLLQSGAVVGAWASVGGARSWPVPAEWLDLMYGATGPWLSRPAAAAAAPSSVDDAAAAAAGALAAAAGALAPLSSSSAPASRRRLGRRPPPTLSDRELAAVAAGLTGLRGAPRRPPGAWWAAARGAIARRTDRGAAARGGGDDAAVSALMARARAALDDANDARQRNKGDRADDS